MGKTASYTNWQEYKENKLAAKQADKMFKTLTILFKENNPDKIQQYYKELHKSHLYIKHGGLYCQVLQDVDWRLK